MVTNSIGQSVFENCSPLLLHLNTNNINTTTLGIKTFKGCSQLQAFINSSIRNIEDEVFMNTGLSVISIPVLLETAGTSAFQNCTSTQFIFFVGNNITSIGNNAFKGLNHADLTSITIPIKCSNCR